jgi:hypothetical protein
MNDLLKELEHTKAELIQIISSVSQEQFNSVPFEGSWTVGQVGEHILKAVNAAVLYADTKPTDRQPDEKIAETKGVFLNFDVKFESPDFILPSSQPKNKHVILSQIENTFNGLSEAAKTLDLSATCLTFEVPGMGAFTRLEFIWFFIFHTQRHIYQLKNIEPLLAA